MPPPEPRRPSRVASMSWWWRERRRARRPRPTTSALPSPPRFLLDQAVRLPHYPGGEECQRQRGEEESRAQHHGGASDEIRGAAAAEYGLRRATEGPSGEPAGSNTASPPTCMCRCGFSRYRNEASSVVSRSVIGTPSFSSELCLTTDSKSVGGTSPRCPLSADPYNYAHSAGSAKGEVSAGMAPRHDRPRPDQQDKRGAGV